MSPRFLAFIPFILKWEGSVFENDPDDSGGATKYGIDQATHPDVNIRKLTKEQAMQIYYDFYWRPIHAEDMPKDIGEICMNIANNCGRNRAIKWLQDAVNVERDGIIGPVTLRAVGIANRENLKANLIARLRNHYISISKGRLAKFRKGWLNRTNDLTSLLA